jgi:hypothetical protein
MTHDCAYPLSKRRKAIFEIKEYRITILFCNEKEHEEKGEKEK